MTTTEHEERPLCDQIERVAALHRSWPLGEARPDYIFREGPVDLDGDDPTASLAGRLSERFAARKPQGP